MQHGKESFLERWAFLPSRPPGSHLQKPQGVRSSYTTRQVFLICKQCLAAAQHQTGGASEGVEGRGLQQGFGNSVGQILAFGPPSLVSQK